MFKIEKNVEIPEKKRGRKKGTSKYPFKDMGVGDSFFIACEDEKKKTKVNTVTTCALSYSKTCCGGSRKFSTRQVDGGVRVWRIK